MSVEGPVCRITCDGCGKHLKISAAFTRAAEKAALMEHSWVEIIRRQKSGESGFAKDKWHLCSRCDMKILGAISDLK